jgi:hypothetical protein
MISGPSAPSSLLHADAGTTYAQRLRTGTGFVVDRIVQNLTHRAINP